MTQENVKLLLFSNCDILSDECCCDIYLFPPYLPYQKFEFGEKWNREETSESLAPSRHPTMPHITPPPPPSPPVGEFSPPPLLPSVLYTPHHLKADRHVLGSHTHLPKRVPSDRNKLRKCNYFLLCPGDVFLMSQRHLPNSFQNSSTFHVRISVVQSSALSPGIVQAPPG